MIHPLTDLLARSLILTGTLFGGVAHLASAQAFPYPPAPETRAWIEAENRPTESYLSQIPQRAALRRRLTQLWNYPKYGAPFHKVGRYFFFKNDGLQNQSVLYKQAS